LLVNPSETVRRPILEIKEHMRTLKKWMTDPVFWIGLFAACYLAVLPMANTIALRNVALLVLLIFLVSQFSKIRIEFRFVLPVLLWAAYLVLFPLITDDHVIAWQSLGGQWGRGLLAMLAGAGVATLLSRRRTSTVFHLGAISAVPILIHLTLFAWKAWEGGSMPWGYWGRETHHADLGYAAGHTVVLMAAAIVAADRRFRPWAITLIIAALLSTTLARSRGGLAFAVLGGLLVFVPAYLAQASQHRRHVLAGLVAMMVAVAALTAFAVKDDFRWRNMLTQLSVGFLGDPILIECEGTTSVEAAIVSKFGAGEQAQSVINSMRDGDGSRMVLLRAGLELAMRHPWGSDGSRHAFQKLLRQECPNPAISMAHTHDGWIDTLLAIGWLGAALYLWVLLHFFRQGVTGLQSRSGMNQWGLALAALSVFWMARGVADSVFRDHMLEMQGFVLAYASVALQCCRDD
jgi:hypothetical protein